MGELKDIITGRQSSKKYRKDNFSNAGARSGDLAGRNLEPQHNSEMTIRKIVSGETEDTTGNNDTGKTSPKMTVNEMFNIINRKKSSNNTSSSTGSDIKSFFSGNLNNANSSAEDLKDAIKNPNKSLNDRVKGLTYMYNAAVATGDNKTAEKMQKEYDELADRVNKQTEINRHNAKEYARSQSLKGMTEERKALVDERNKYALDNGLVTSTGIDTRKKDRYKVYSEYNSKIDELDKQIAEKQRNGEYDLSDSQKAVLADIGNKANKLTESFENKYKNSTLEQRLNARLHATTSELNWLNKHMYDNSSSKELEDYNNQLNKEANSLWNQRDEEQAYNRLKAIEDEQGKLKTAIDNAKLSEQKKKEYDDIVNNDIKAKTVLQKYYALQEYSSNQSLVRSEENTDGVKNQVILDDYNYINKLSVKERNQIVKDFNNLKKEGYDTESLYKWYKRERDAESAAETTRVYTDYADKHPVLGSLQSVGVRLTGAVPDAVKYISTDLDKKYNGGDGYINPEETGTAISDAMRAKVSENINNDFGSFLYNTGMSMADFASLLPLNAVPGGQALSLGIMGTSAGVGSANEVINNGGTIDNAVKTGIASGIAETLFEKVSLEQLSAFRSSGKSTFRAAVGNVLKGAFTEGSEEAFTDLANRLTDDAINKDLSSYNLSKKNYMEQGMNEAEAENAASWDFWKNVGLDFAGGAISGGVLNLATAGINLAGAKIDMAQNKESNAQIGKAVMADENFDLDLLIRQGLATDKNDKAYNYAKHMQKLVETDNEGKISAGDVGNLMYLINREVAKNPELVNKIAQVKKQNTQEQGNKTVNAQNEQNPTQQNTAQNGQQNAEQAQANTVINATKKADTEAIGKMYGVYAFGKKHPNGIIATDTSTGKVVKVALKSLESSSKINRSDDENTLVFNTNDGKQVNADSITFSDSQLDTIVHSANEFDTYGARNYISNFEEWRESPQAQKMTDDEMLYKYNRAYSAAYSFGREGVKLDSLRETSEYKILTNILGEQIVSQALSTGRRDVDINTQHHANRLTELINRNGRADTSGVSVYADSGTDVSHIPQELINTLGNLSQKTGRNIIISDRLADGVNGVARDGNIILSSEISSQKILATALHEAGHMIKKTNPTEWRTLSNFVSDYLVRKGVDLNKMIDRTIERYGNRLQTDEHENTRDAALEEIVCDTLMSIASDEKALNIALRTKQNKSKIAAAIKSLINKVKDWLIGKSQNYGAKAFARDLEALENLAQRFSEAADTAKENITEQTEVQNGEKIAVEKYSIGSTDNIVQAKFDDNVNKKINNITQSKQFIRWFGDWQNSPAKASKAVDNNGEPLVLYHQTGKEFTTFDTKQKGSGKFDSEMPTGIFMKPTNNDIGVGGNIQMPLYASIKNPLIVNNRSELVKFYDKNVQGYTKAKSAIDSVNEKYKAKFNEEMKRENEEYQKLWNAKKNGEISEEEYQKSISRDALDEIMEEWENKVNEASRNAKALVDDYFKNSNYDGVIVNNDVGSFGRSTKTFIAFENTQVKSATDNIGTFDGNNPDIRYSLDEDYDFTDEKAGAIHDTLKFSIDDEYDDLFDFSGNDEQHIDFDKAVDKNNPELTIEQIYHHSARNVKEGLLAGKGIKPEQKKIYNMVKSVMRSYHINPNAETDSLITEYVDALNTFIDAVQNDKSNFTDAFEDFVLKCRDTLRYSTQLDEQHEAWAKEIRDELKGTTLLIPENAIDTIKENYGSVGKYKKALFGKINVKLEHNAKGINGNAVGSYIEDIGSHLENIGGRSLMIEDGFDWDSDSGYRMLDHIMNYVLAPQYVATYDGKFESESTIDSAAIQMAFDTTAEYLKQQGKAAVMQNNIDKRKLRDINKALRQAEKAKTALNKKTIENYKTDIAEQKAKYNEQREKYRQAYNALKDTKSEEAKRYRDKIHELEELSKNQKAIIKTDKETLRAQYTEKREQTKYMQMLGRKFDKLVKKFDAKSKNTENIPESLKRPILNVLIGFKESADPGQYKNGGKKTIPKYFGAWNNVAEIGEQVRNLYEEYRALEPKPKKNDEGKEEKESTPKGMQYSYIDINSIAYNERTLKMLEIVKDEFAEYATDENGETIYDADGKPIKIGYKNIFNLDSADLRLLYDTMTALEASLTQATEIIVNGQRESIAGAAAKALDEISNVNYNKDVKINVLSKNTIGNKINAALSDMKELSNRFVATSLDPVRYGRFLSGYNDDSIVAKLFRDLHDGDVKREKIMQKAYTKVQSVAYQYSEKDLSKIQKDDVKEFDFKDTETGERVKVSQGIIMSIYLTDQQSSGRRHLLADRLNHYTVLPDLDSANSRRHSKQEKAKSENHHKVRFTLEDLQHIKRYVESNKMLREISGAISEVLNNELQQEINEVSMSKYGMLIATVRNYFPISVYGDGAAYEKDFSAEFNDLRMKSRGFVKRRESSYAPIVIDDVFRVFNRHTSSVAEWCGLTTPIENFKKVYNWINTNSLNGITLHEAIMHKYGKVAEHYIDKLMGDLQKSKDTIDNNLLTRMQGNYMGAVLLLNPGAMIKQFAAFPTANAYFGTKNVAIASAGGMWRIDLEKYAEYTPYLWYRAEGNGTVVGELSKKAGVVGGLKDKIDIMGKVDRYVVGCLLKAAELHVEQTTKLKKGSDAFYKEVVKQFEKCVDETQPNNMVTSKPQFIRNNYLKILSMNAFRSQTMAIGNTIIDSYMEYRTRSNDYKLSKSAENKSAKKVAMKKFAKALIGATESALLIGGLTTLVNMLLWHKWDDERDDKGNVTAENIFKSILDYSMESFAGTFTFGDTAYSAIAHKIDNDRPFYGLDSMSLDNVNNFVENISNGDYILAATLLGDCFGLPASNIKRMALSLTSYFTDLTKGRGEIISDNKGNVDTTVLVPLMINATIDGDANKAQYYEQLYVNTIMDKKGKTEKEARDMLEQKVITALSKNNDDIEKAAVARANGDLNTYESLINKVSSYGFGKDDVIKASDKVISNIIANMKKESITDEDAAKSDLVDNQGFTEQGAEYVWKKMSSSVDDEKSEESIFDSTGNDDTLMYKYTDAFEYLKNGDTVNYEKVEKYLMEHKGKTKNQIKKLMQSASRTDPMFEQYISASKSNDADTTHTLYRQLLNIYSSESKFKSALRKYQDKIKKQQSK